MRLKHTDWLRSEPESTRHCLSGTVSLSHAPLWVIPHASFLLLCGLCSFLAQAEILTGQVVKIADGDTLTVLDTSKQQHRIRLTGIDAPERKQAFGTVSKQHLANLIFGRAVTVEWRKRDRYQRILGKVLVDGQDANLEQIKAGLAWHYKQYGKDQQPVDRLLYAEAEEAARIKGVGLWRDLKPIPPWYFRRK